ncbi:hypothetical protein [Bremerella sp. P1]|uniref:hypothetical protein n=1 Tax=Bremerella sp. P1 TaxID=3026424 RepID=UPI00236753A8|nr:hypothetical protein [Bremerella sp. P1]WDI41501.1 hypothetical protein PSR63_23840 [Bremerella sp. P1]
MVSSQGSFWWMDKEPSQNSSASLRPQRKPTLWLTDQDRCVNRLLTKIEKAYGDPIVRVSGELFESPEYLVSVIEESLGDYAIGEVVILGHSYFLPSGQAFESFRPGDSASESTNLLQRMAKRQEANKLAEQRLLGVNLELAQLCALNKHPLIAEIQVTSLFFRVESHAVCCYNERTMQFEALGTGS